MSDTLATQPDFARPRRLASVDALRGITVAAMLLVNDPGSWDHVFWPLDHAAWNGITPTDYIFPFFLFIMGVSIALAILPKVEQGHAPARLRNAALWRAARIIALGIAINVLAAWLMPGRDMRWPGVLQRIGLCFAVAGMLAIYTPRRGWIIAIVALLAAYTMILVAGGSLHIYQNLPDRVDTAVFGHYLWDYNHATGQGHDPEGLLSSLDAIVTSLLGLCAGMWLRARRMRPLLVAAVILLVLGGLWACWIPFNKNLWTPSFTLWTAGWGTLVLAAFHRAVDEHHWPAWGRRFGVNAIAAYAGSEVMQVLLPTWGWQDALYQPLANLIGPVVGLKAASLTFAIGFVLLWWIIIRLMDKRHWYLKI